MQISVASGSVFNGLAIIGTGAGLMAPEEKWIGVLIVLVGLFALVFDVKLERGHIAIGTPQSLRKRMLAMWPQMLMGMSVAGFAIGLAGYFAGQHQTPPAIPSAQNVQHATPAFRYVWDALTPQEMSIIRTNLRQLIHPSDRPVFVGCPNDNCRDLAESFETTFKDLGWSGVSVEQRQPPDNNFKGLTIQYFVKEQNPSINYESTDPKIALAIADAIEHATQGRLKTRVQPASLIPTRIIIGPKP
jgi:hypothetical protein